MTTIDSDECHCGFAAPESESAMCRGGVNHTDRELGWPNIQKVLDCLGEPNLYAEK